MAAGGARSLRTSIDLPPLFRVVTLREMGDAFAHAQHIAGEAGAGTIVWARRFDLADFAVVLEPDEPLSLARRSSCAAMVALAEAVASHCPAAIPVSIEWPATLRFDGSIVGGGRLAWPKGASEDGRPDWLVFGAMLRMHAMREIEPGLHTMGASLVDAGFEDVDAGFLVESFARSLLALTDQWSRDGFKSIAARYESWLTPAGGKARAVRDNGDLVMADEAMSLADGLRVEPSWRDPETGEPKL